MNPPPEFVGPKIAAWFGFTDKFGCDPCEKAKPKRNKQCLYYKVETYWCKEGGGPPKGEVCKPTPAPVKAYSYNFETMQPTMSPTPQVP